MHPCCDISNSKNTDRSISGGEMLYRRTRGLKVDHTSASDFSLYILQCQTSVQFTPQPKTVKTGFLQKGDLGNCQG